MDYKSKALELFNESLDITPTEDMPIELQDVLKQTKDYNLRLFLLKLLNADFSSFLRVNQELKKIGEPQISYEEIIFLVTSGIWKS